MTASIDDQELEALTRFTEHFAMPFFQACILIEVCQLHEYAPFYENILGAYEKMLEEGISFNCTRHVQKAYDGFDSRIKSQLKKIPSTFETRAISAKRSCALEDCMEKLDLFRAFEIKSGGVDPE